MRLMFWASITGCGAGGAVVDEADKGATDAGDADTDADSDADSDADTDADGSCQSWLVTYDLTGSTFIIRSTQDFDVVLQEPYADDLNMGPGHVTLRMSDAGGAPGVGPVSLVEYYMDWNFVVGVPNLAEVATNILNEGGPEACGIAAGTLTGVDLQWSPAEMSNVCQNGEISCEGGACGLFGTPPADQPEIITDDCEPHAINAFAFNADLTTFDMLAVSITDTADTQTALNFHGSQVSAELDPNPPACACP